MKVKIFHNSPLLIVNFFTNFVPRVVTITIRGAKGRLKMIFQPPSLNMRKKSLFTFVLANYICRGGH